MEYNEKLMSLIGAARTLTSSLDLETVLRQLTSEVSRVIDGAHGILLFLYDEDRDQLRIRMTGGYFNLEEMRHSVLAPGEGMSGSVFAAGKGHIFRSTEETEKMMMNIRPGSRDAYTKALGGYFLPTSVLSVPMLARDKAIGVLTVDAFDEKITFNEEDLELLETFAAQASIAIENAILFARNERTQMIHEALSNVALARGGTRDITRTLADLIGEKVVLVNDVFDLLESSSSAAKNGALSLLETEKEAVIETVSSKDPSLFQWGSAAYEQAFFFPIRSEGSTLGYLAVLMDGGSRLDPLDRFAIEQTSVVFAGEMSRRKRDIIEAAAARGELLIPLLDSEWQDLSYMQIASLPYHPVNEADYIAAHTTLLQPVESGGTNPLLRYLTRSLLEDEENTYILHRGQELTILFTLPVADESSLSTVRRRLEEFTGQVERYANVRTASGIGRTVRHLKDVRTSYRDALKCAETARSSGGMLTPEDLGPDRLFMSLEHSELEGYVEEKLTPILAYENERGASLLPSLETYLEHNQSLRAASDALFIHVNTLKYRLNTIRTLLGIESLDGRTLFELQLALYIRQYMQRTSR
ncbi:MAG: GAF domain-containing protein [Alkalicoccus sp.]|nr:MAG: GAF domain-containing protein [Alkalicoccus sp.]